MKFIEAWEPDNKIKGAIKLVERDFQNYLDTFYDDKNNDGYKQLLADCPAILEDFINMENKPNVKNKIRFTIIREG